MAAVLLAPTGLIQHGPLAMRLLIFQSLFSLERPGGIGEQDSALAGAVHADLHQLGHGVPRPAVHRACLRRPPTASMAVDKQRKHPETDPFGIVAGFTDAAGAAHTTSDETRAALKAAMRADPHAEAPEDDGGHAVRVLVPGSDRQAARAAPTWCWRTAPSAPSRGSCRGTCRPATTACTPRGTARAADISLIVSPGPLLPARRSADLGIRRAGLRRALAGELGNRRSGRSGAHRALHPAPRRRAW